MFFNKHDLFEKKISKYPLSELFDDYKGMRRMSFSRSISNLMIGDDTLEDSVEFIMSQFKNRYHGSEDHYHVFITCSLDWNELDEAIAKIREIMKKQDEKLWKVRSFAAILCWHYPNYDFNKLGMFIPFIVTPFREAIGGVLQRVTVPTPHLWCASKSNWCTKKEIYVSQRMSRTNNEIFYVSIRIWRTST